METILIQWFKNQNAVTQSKLGAFVSAKLREINTPKPCKQQTISLTLSNN